MHAVCVGHQYFFSIDNRNVQMREGERKRKKTNYVLFVSHRVANDINLFSKHKAKVPRKINEQDFNQI